MDIGEIYDADRISREPPLQTESCYVRVLHFRGIVQFAKKHNFDRWANSVKFEHFRMPGTQRELDIIVNTVEMLVDELKDGKIDDDWCEVIDVGDHIRRAKKRGTK